MNKKIEGLLSRLKDAPLSRGRRLYQKYLTGGKITPMGAIVAKCCECLGFYADGRIDCENPSCPLYPWMPYRAERKKPAKQAESTTWQ